MTGLIITTKEELLAIVKEAMQTTPTAPTTAKRKLYTKEEVRDLFAVSMVTIDRWSKQGKLKRVEVVGRVYYNAEQVDSLLQ